MAGSTLADGRSERPFIVAVSQKKEARSSSLFAFWRLLCRSRERLRWLVLAGGARLVARRGISLDFRFARIAIVARVVDIIGAGKFVHLFLGGFLGDAVTLLDLPDQLVLLAGDDRQIVVCQLAPLFFHCAC